MLKDIHIVSLMIQVRPEYKQAVIDKAVDIPSAEYFSDEGVNKLVLVFEADSESELIAQIDKINSWQGVLSSQLCYHHCEPNAALQEEMSYANNPA